MGATENKIFEMEIRAFEPEIRRAIPKADAGEPASAPNSASDILDTFDLEQASSLLKLKIFKKKLETIIVTFETYIDPQKFPETSVSSIKDALNYISSEFHLITEDSSMEKTIINTLEGIQEHLWEAQAYILEAASSLDEGKGKKHDYYVVLLKCRQHMFDIKKLLKALILETNDQRK